MIDYPKGLSERLQELAQRARELRLLRELRQSELADRAGVGIATVQRFERTGKAVLENVLRIATALAVESGFDALFGAPAYASLDEALAHPAVVKRQRAPRKSVKLQRVEQIAFADEVGVPEALPATISRAVGVRVAKAQSSKGNSGSEVNKRKTSKRKAHKRKAHKRKAHKRKATGGSRKPSPS